MTSHVREPIFNVPAIVLGLIAVFVGVHLVREFLPDQVDHWVVLAFAFIPARFSAPAGALPGEPWAGAASFVSHAFLHGDWMHLAINSAWLMAVGTPLARRMTAVSLLGFMAICAAGGALLFWLVHPGLAAPMVGASGAISGLMAGMFRLMFAAQSDDERALLRDDPAAARCLSLREVFTTRQSLIAVAVWVGINLLAVVGLGATGAGAIAWEAHLGGFFTGLLTFSLWDRDRAVQHQET